ncbi:hypothetical protein CQ046_13110 [Chryseobacterium sp. MYb7]|jgi:hypothetical protein|nr:hypothetical protein CQ046_13110 [Chryseobacterium sp. MYb7]
MILSPIKLKSTNFILLQVMNDIKNLRENYNTFFAENLILSEVEIFLRLKILAIDDKFCAFALNLTFNIFN